MHLIKISTDKVSIKTDDVNLTGIKINDLIQLSDETASIICTVISIASNEVLDVSDEASLEECCFEASSAIEAAIIGSVKNGLFCKSVDHYPMFNAKISKVSKALFNAMLATDHTDAFTIGQYAAYGEKASLDGNKFFRRHSSVVGNTGSGKSYCVSSILQKISIFPGANVILFDLHGEYKNLSFVKSIKIGSDGFPFPLWFLPFRDICGFFLKLKEDAATTQIAALRKAFYAARCSDKNENIPVAFDLEALIDLLDEQNNEIIPTGEVYKTGDKTGMSKTVKGENHGKLTSTIALLEDKLIDKRYRFMTDYKPQTYLHDFISAIYGTPEKNIKALDLSDVPHDMVPVIVAMITRLLYQVQLQQRRDSVSPINIVCEEAHTYIPSSELGLTASQRRMLDIFETIAKEGRKFGVTLTIISQRPSELNKTIMAQVENYIVLKMTNETDKQFIKSILPESNRSVINMLSLFSPGDCFAIGDAASIIFKIHMDEPLDAPASNTLNVWEQWRNGRTADVDALIQNLMD